MEPIRESDGHLLVEGKRWVGIVDDQRTPQAVGVLASVMRVVPVGASLISLSRLECFALVTTIRLAFHR